MEYGYGYGYGVDKVFPDFYGLLFGSEGQSGQVPGVCTSSNSPAFFASCALFRMTTEVPGILCPVYVNMHRPGTRGKGVYREEREEEKKK